MILTHHERSSCELILDKIHLSFAQDESYLEQASPARTVRLRLTNQPRSSLLLLDRTGAWRPPRLTSRAPLGALRGRRGAFRPLRIRTRRSLVPGGGRQLRCLWRMKRQLKLPPNLGSRLGSEAALRPLAMLRIAHADGACCSLAWASLRSKQGQATAAGPYDQEAGLGWAKWRGSAEGR